MVRVNRPEDLAPFTEYMRNVEVRVLSDENRFVSLALMKKPLTRIHEERELAGYVNTWNAINPSRQVKVI
jgi:hypothetical protein